MEYDDAFWRLVDIPNLERRLTDAEDAVTRADEKIAKAESHLTEARGAKERALGEAEAADMALQEARARAAEIPEALAVEASVDVDRRNRVRDAVTKAMAGAAEATGEVNGDN